MGEAHEQQPLGGLHSCAGPYSKSCLKNAGDSGTYLGRHRVEEH